MKQSTLTWTITSLLTALLSLFHLADDVAHGYERGGPEMYTAIFMLVVWLMATLLLNGRRSGYIIIMIGSLAAAGIPYLHTGKAGWGGGRMAHAPDLFFWALTLLSLGVTGIFGFVLSVHGLWGLRKRRVDV